LPAPFEVNFYLDEPDGFLQGLSQSAEQSVN